MLAKMEDRTQNYEIVMYVCERFCWNLIVNNLQVHDIFVHKKGSKKSWDNLQDCMERCIAHLDRIYTPKIY